MPSPTATALLDHLGDEAALHRRGHGWTFLQHVAVRTLEEVNSVSRILMRSGGVPANKLPPPLIVPRPGEPPPEVEPAEPPRPTRSWVRDLMGAMGAEVVTVG